MPSERRGRRERARLEEMLRLRPPEQTLAWSEVDRIDDERLWWTLRGMDRDRLLVLLARALGEVPAHRLESVLGDHVRPGDIGASCDQLLSCRRHVGSPKVVLFDELVALRSPHAGRPSPWRMD